MCRRGWRGWGSRCGGEVEGGGGGEWPPLMLDKGGVVVTLRSWVG